MLNVKFKDEKMPAQQFESYDEIIYYMKLSSKVRGSDIKEHIEKIRNRLKVMYGVKTNANTAKGIVKALEKVNWLKVEEN